MRKIAYALVAGSLMVSGAAYAAGTTTPAKDQVAKQAKVKHAKKAAKPASTEPKAS